MGVVYEARQPSLNRRVAVKVLPAAFATDRARLQRFRVEAQSAAAVAHPNIVTVYAIGEDRGVHYYAMRLIDGAALDTLVASASTPPDAELAATQLHIPASEQSNGTSNFPIADRTPRGPERRSLRLVAAWHGRTLAARTAARSPGSASQIARARSRAPVRRRSPRHQAGEPCSSTATGTSGVTDFGLAQLADGPAAHAHRRARSARSAYMSPRTGCAGDRRRLPTTVHRDVYSLAATIYELATGAPDVPVGGTGGAPAPDRHHDDPMPSTERRGPRVP